MQEQQMKVGDVVAWPEVPSRAFARGKAKHGREAFYFRCGNDGWYVGGVAPLTERRDFLDIPPHGNCWPQWNDWPGGPERVTIIALDVPADATADDLRVLAEVFEVREAVDAHATEMSSPWHGYANAITLEMGGDEPIVIAEVEWKNPAPRYEDVLQIAAERLHTAGWRPGMTAEDAVLFLRMPFTCSTCGDKIATREDLRTCQGGHPVVAAPQAHGDAARAIAEADRGE